MLRFANPSLLYLLFLVGVLVALVLWRWGQLSLKRATFSHEDSLPGLTNQVDFKRKRTRWLLGLLAAACWIIALANPQLGTRTRIAEVKSTELLIALDISESMLSEDIRPNRLSRAQNFIFDLVESLDGEQVGLVFFAGQAYLQVPLTTDYGTVKLFAQAANPDQISYQGTNFGSAINLARQVLERQEDEVATRKMVVLISDGENHEPLAEELIQEAADEGMVFYTVGLGTEAGGTIPARSRTAGTVKRSNTGETVITKFDPTSLQKLADIGRGRYFDLNTNSQGAVRSIAQAVAEGPSSNVGEETFVESASYFQLFIFLGLVSLVLAFLVARRGTAKELLGLTRA